MRLSALMESSRIWYHGVPDARELEKTWFQNRESSHPYIKDLHAWNEINDAMEDVERGSSEYFALLDKRLALATRVKAPTPVFLTDVSSVAKTYADDRRAIDYQNAEPKLYRVTVDESGANILKLNMHGLRFSGLPLPRVEKAFRDAGVSQDKLDEMLARLQVRERTRDVIKTDTLGVIAVLLGFDIVDVLGVLDSYMGGNTKSTVRMVFDVTRIHKV